jgi:hypothetical protein
MKWQVRLCVEKETIPHAIVFVTPNFNPQGQDGTYEIHNLGIFYQHGKWATFNQDNAAMYTNVAFDVVTIA